MDPQLLAMMAPTTIYVAAVTGTADSTGKPGRGTPAARTAWVEREDKVFDAGTKTEKVTTHIIVVQDAIGVQDRIWLPGDSSATAALARVPYSVEPIRNGAGTVDHYEVRV